MVKTQALPFSLLTIMLLLFQQVWFASSETIDPRLNGVSNDLTADQIYFLDRSIINEFLYPFDTATADTPYVVRYVLTQVICAYDTTTSCTPSSLSFLGVRLNIPSRICSENRLLAHTILILTHRVLLSEFPDEGASLGIILNHLDLLQTLDSEADEWVTGHTKRLINFLRHDGWNSPSYSDTTGYLPFNSAGRKPSNLNRPLRWQPATRYISKGRSISQVHVFPQIGRKVMPLALSKEQYFAKHRRSKNPYKWANARKKIAEVDIQKVKGMAAETMNLSSSASPKQHALAVWWDSKLASTGIINLFYAKAMSLAFPEVFAFLLGDMIAQHDAIILAWREKRKHDLARPFPIIRRISNPNWESLLQAQPHSEFPSASAMLCTASMEHANEFAKNKTGIEKLPVFRGSTGKSIFNLKSVGAFTIKFDTPKDAAKQCGESRLWAGVHFRSAVEEGERIVGGIGRFAFEHVSDLFNGKVPNICRRCGKF